MKYLNYITINSVKKAHLYKFSYITFPNFINILINFNLINIAIINEPHSIPPDAFAAQ